MNGALEMLQFEADALSKLAPHQFNFKRWLVDNGEACGDPIRIKGVRLRPQKQCFMNSMRQLIEWKYGDPDKYAEWHYCEGVVRLSDLPLAIDHAWLVNADGDVLDLTLRNQKGCDYYGVPFDNGWAIDTAMKQEYYGLFSDGIRYLPVTHQDLPPEARAWPKKESAHGQKADA